MILGYDDGNHTKKTSEKKSIESKITTEEQLFNDSVEVEYNNKLYILGEGEYETELNKTDKEHFMVFLLTSIALSTNDLENAVVIGLPVQHYKVNRDRIKQMINERRMHKIKIKGNERHIVISDCEVFPEGVAAYYSLTDEQKQGCKGKDIVMIDIGGRTTDICLLKDQNGKRKVENPLTMFTGMINIYDDFIKAINSKFTLDKNLEDGEKILKNGLEIYGVKQDLSFTKGIIKKHIDRIFKELNINYPIQTEKVILTGGGSYLLAGAFKQRIPNLIVLEDASFSNAIGLKRVGESLWQGKY